MALAILAGLLAIAAQGAPTEALKPNLGDCLHFVNYTPPELEGQEQAALVTRISDFTPPGGGASVEVVDGPPGTPAWWTYDASLSGYVNLVYFTGDPADPENPPPLTEFKFNVPHDNRGRALRTYHYCWEHGQRSPRLGR